MTGGRSASDTRQWCRFFAPVHADRAAAGNQDRHDLRVGGFATGCLYDARALDRLQRHGVWLVPPKLSLSRTGSAGALRAPGVVSAVGDIVAMTWCRKGGGVEGPIRFPDLAVSLTP